MTHFTDAETAVMYDSLLMARRDLQGRGLPTPNIDSAIRKLDAIIMPYTDGLNVEANERGS
jgi:hypothetical protein